MTHVANGETILEIPLTLPAPQQDQLRDLMVVYRSASCGRCHGPNLGTWGDRVWGDEHGER